MLNSANINNSIKQNRSKIFISKQPTNIFTNALVKSGKLEKKPKLDYALYLAFKEVKAELCNNNVLIHLENQSKRNYDKVRYNLNWDPINKKYGSNIITVQIPNGPEYKIYKTQFFTDSIIRDIVAEKIQDWYKLKFNLHATLKANQKDNFKDWECFVIVKHFKTGKDEEYEELVSDVIEDEPKLAKEAPKKSFVKPGPKIVKETPAKDEEEEPKKSAFKSGPKRFTKRVTIKMPLHKLEKALDDREKKAETNEETSKTPEN
jgi:hypothetical protein